MTPTRPLLRYHGGKWRLGPWIMRQFPPHEVYIEPYGGGASVLLAKMRAQTEIYNDLDGEIVNLFEVVRDRGEDLRRAIELTPYARTEFELSFEPTEDPLERARRVLIRSWMGFGGNLTRQNSDGKPQRTGFRCFSRDRRGSYAREWTAMPEVIDLVMERLRGVVIERREAIECMQHYDGPKALHYVDPPYVHETRSLVVIEGKLGYRHEMDVNGHRRLAVVLRSLGGGGNHLGICLRSLRSRALSRLAANRAAGARRWRPRAHGSALDAEHRARAV